MFRELQPAHLSPEQAGGNPRAFHLVTGGLGSRGCEVLDVDPPLTHPLPTPRGRHLLALTQPHPS